VRIIENFQQVIKYELIMIEYLSKKKDMSSMHTTTMFYQGTTSNTPLEESESKRHRLNCLRLLTKSSKKMKNKPDSKILRRLLTMTRGEMKKEKEKYFIPNFDSNLITINNKNNNVTNKMPEDSNQRKKLPNVGCERYNHVHEAGSVRKFADPFPQLCNRTNSHLGFNGNTECNNYWYPPQYPLRDVVNTATTQPCGSQATVHCNSYRKSFGYEEYIKTPIAVGSTYHKDYKKKFCCESRYCAFGNTVAGDRTETWNSCEIPNTLSSKSFKRKMDKNISSRHMLPANNEKNVPYEIKGNQSIIGFRNTGALPYKEKEIPYHAHIHSLSLPSILPSKQCIDTIISDSIKNNYHPVN
jgi:hypothetical protein